MDLNVAQKIEQAIDPVSPQPDVVREQSQTPEVSPVVEVVEQKPETVMKAPEKIKEEPVAVVAERILSSVPITPVAPVRPVKDRLTQEIEDVLEEDLKEMYLAMPKDQQVEFRKKGEETISLVSQLVREAHVNVKKIFQLIRAWLKMIPGVNRYFLEQEAKIKTDKVLFVSEEEKKRGSKL